MAREEVLAQKLRDGSMSAEQVERLRHMVGLAAEEARRGASYVIERVCVVGRKPGGENERDAVNAKVCQDGNGKPWYQRSLGDLLGLAGRSWGVLRS